MTSDYENLTVEKKIRATIYRDTRSICNEACHSLGLDVNRAVIDVVAKLVYMKLGVYALDLEAFAKHSKRNTINADDVKLLARRNPSLKACISKLTSSSSSATKEKRKKSSITPSVSNKIATITNQPTLIANQLITTSPSTSHSKALVDDVNEAMAVDETVDLTFD